MAELAKVAARLCASLFSGGEIEHARAHAITSPFVVTEHSHAELLQFDWIVNCRGSITIDRATTALSGGCAFVLVAPRQPHAMSLESTGEEARVYHTRIAMTTSERRTMRVRSHVVTALPANRSMEAALNDVWRLTIGGIRRPLLRAAKLAEAIALWPGVVEEEGASAAVRVSEGLDRDLDQALRLMETSVASPMSLDDLADAASLSVRHFTRRFRDAFGIAPMAFLDRKRLALAQQMLAYEAATVGEVSDRMGFSSPAVFSRWFANLAGESPRAYRSRPHQL